MDTRKIIELLIKDKEYVIGMVRETHRQKNMWLSPEKRDVQGFPRGGQKF